MGQNVFNTSDEIGKSLSNDIVAEIKQVFGVKEFTDEEFTVVVPYSDNQGIITKREVDDNGDAHVSMNVTDCLWVKPVRDGVLDIYESGDDEE